MRRPLGTPHQAQEVHQKHYDHDGATRTIDGAWLHLKPLAAVAGTLVVMSHSYRVNEAKGSHLLEGQQPSLADAV